LPTLLREGEKRAEPVPEGKEARPGEAAAAAAAAAAVDEVGKGDDRRQTYNEEGETLGCEGALAP